VSAPANPPIIIKRKSGHGGHGHHSGAWKVAYADFATAMMALFIVLWLQGANDGVKKAVGAYFNDPMGRAKDAGSGVAGSGETLVLDQERLAELKQVLEMALEKAPELGKLKKQVQMTITGEGLRIELLETEAGFFFQSGNSTPTNAAKQLIATFAAELSKLGNPLTIEGHTDSRPFGSAGTYTNWELSTDRANAARRVMELSGVNPAQITQVRGYADRRLRKPEAPNDPANRRVSVIVQSSRVPALDEQPATTTKDQSAPAAAAHH
jgi:chemotaxis protein MotB